MIKSNKKEIINLCLANQKEQIDNIEKRVNAINDDAISHNQSASQSEDRTAGKVELLNALRTELDFAKQEMAYLKNIDPLIENTNISLGAIVITNQLTFFIAISSEKIEVNGNEIVCISPKAPIYQVMKGLQKGASFAYNEMNYEIEEIQ